MGLSLKDLTEDNTIVQKYPMRVKQLLGPYGAVISPLQETRARVDNSRDELGYTSQVALFRASNQGLTQELPDDLSWRSQLSNTLSQCLLPGVPEIHTVDCVPGPIMLPDAFGSQYDVSVTMFRCYTNVVNAVYPPTP